MNTVRKLKRECTIEWPFMLPHCWWSAPHCVSLPTKSVINSSNSQVDRRDLMDAVLNFFIQLWMSIGLNISQIQSSVILFQDCQLNLEENISGLRVIAATEKSKLFLILSSRHRNMEGRSGHPTLNYNNMLKKENDLKTEEIYKVMLYREEWKDQRHLSSAWELVFERKQIRTTGIQ